jgi:hypothetical protein
MLNMSSTTLHSHRINFRMLIFAAVMLAVIGYPVYIFLHETVTGGITDYGTYKLVDLKAMSNFEMDQANATQNDVPEKWRQLDGQRVALEGEMWDAKGAGDEVRQFQLVYSIAKCCFSGPPKVQHFVNATVLPGKTAYYYRNLVRVVGTLHVQVKHDEGRVSSVYQLDVESIEPK